MIKIVFFAPYPDILPVIEQVFRERPESEAIQYEVVQDFYNNRLEQVEADVVIARGFTAHTLKRKNIPCAELKSTGYDVMKAVNECMQKGNIERIAVVVAFNMVYGAEQMCHLYPNLGLGCYAEDDETKLEMAVHQAMKDGNQAIVGIFHGPDRGVSGYAGCHDSFRNRGGKPCHFRGHSGGPSHPV